MRRSRILKSPGRWDGSVGRQDGLVARYDSGSRRMMPTMTSATMRPPTSPRRSPPPRAAASEPVVAFDLRVAVAKGGVGKFDWDEGYARRAIEARVVAHDGRGHRGTDEAW